MLVFVVIASMHSMMKHNLGLDLVYISELFYCLLDSASTAKKANSIYAASGVAPVYINRHLCIRGFM